MRLADLGRKVVLRQRRFDPRNKITAIHFIVDVLQLAPAAFRKVTAWRHLMMRSGCQRAIVEQGVSRHAPLHMTTARRDPVAPRGDADDQFVHRAMAEGIAAARSSAIIWGPAISAARPC